jgi:hypothetical protein
MGIRSRKVSRKRSSQGLGTKTIGNTLENINK